MTEDEKYLFDRIRAGDEAAFKVIYNRYIQRLYYFIREYVPFNDIVENIIQETMMALWEKRSQLAADSNLGAWLFTVAKNNCLYKIRDSRYQQKRFQPAKISDQELKLNMEAIEVLDTSQLIFSEIEKIIEDTLEQLPPQCRTVFRLSRFEALKNKEIAEELGISEKTVEGHITKALKVLRGSLKDYLPVMAFLFH
ncbi:MAG: RNA polymerase sigma-70 factor [Prolixibacteraceae bacterium]